MCRRKPCSLCCQCVWQHCRSCAKHVFGIRILLVTLSVIDVLVMLWFIYSTLETYGEIENCCGIVHYPKPEVSDYSMDAYSECVQLNYETLIVSDYSNFIFNSKDYYSIKWDAFVSILTYYDINVSVSAISHGCVINHYDCFTETVQPCIDAKYINDQSLAAKTNKELEAMCQENMSKKAKLYVVAGIFLLASIKILLICIGICSKLYRNEFRPRNEALHNILYPTYCPQFIEKRKNNAYAKMKDEEENNEHKYKYKALQLYVFWNCVKCVLLFPVLMLRMFRFMLCKSYFLLIYMTNLACSMALFLLHNSPVLGIDGVDFCVSGAESVACIVGQNECGIVSWIIMPHIAKYLLPRYITLTVSWLAFLGRFIEKCAVCKLQDMIINKDGDIIKDLHVNQKRELDQFMQLSVNDLH